jgi:hypothetical protein
VVGFRPRIWIDATSSPLRDHCQPKARPGVSRPVALQPPNIQRPHVACRFFAPPPPATESAHCSASLDFPKSLAKSRVCQARESPDSLAVAGVASVLDRGSFCASSAAIATLTLSFQSSFSCSVGYECPVKNWLCQLLGNRIAPAPLLNHDGQRAWRLCLWLADEILTQPGPRRGVTALRRLQCARYHVPPIVQGYGFEQRPHVIAFGAPMRCRTADERFLLALRASPVIGSPRANMARPPAPADSRASGENSVQPQRNTRPR